MRRGSTRTAGASLVAGVLLALAPAAAFGASTDLSIDKTDNADPVTVDTQLTYTLAVANAGPDTANGIEVTDDLPNQLDVVSADPTQGSCDVNGKKVSCALGSLATQASATVELIVIPRKAGQIVNEATVSGADPDPVAANNADTETTTVIEAPPAPTCNGQTATVVGTDGDDVLVGTEKKDVIVALGGDDAVRGLGGADVICTASGADTIRGESGGDLVRSGGGADILKGGEDNDLLRGGGGGDRLSGGSGADGLRGGTGADKCRGGPGRDTKRSC